MTARNAAQAEAWARGQISGRSQDWTRLCLSFVRQAFGLDYPAGWPTSSRNAGTAWDRAKYKHATSNPDAIPAGVPVFWELPSVADHVAFSLGHGLCISTDARRAGHADVVTIDSITRAWGGKLLGWTEDLIGERVYTPTPARVRNHVTAARRQLAAARRSVKRAADELDKTPAGRRVARGVADQLDELDEQLAGYLRKLPES